VSIKDFHFLEMPTIKRLVEFFTKFSPENKKKMRYLAVGIWNTIFPYIVFAFIYYITNGKLHYVIILVLCQVIGLTNAYVCYKFFVFKTKGNVVREYLRFYVVYGTTFIINLVLIGLFVEVFGLNPVLSQGVIAVAIVVIAYLGHNRFSFSAK
jgi:putative flippase GtrA